MSHAQQVKSQGIFFVHAYAKVNLTLDVLGQRADGYHELVTIMQTIDLHDTICLAEATDESVRISCNVPDLCAADNLAVRAAHLVRRRLAIRRGLLIELHKRIPMAAGLGGGSSDAAAILLALRQWWHLPLTSTDLLELAADLGSDVPFFLVGGLALCEGRGERVTPLAPRWPISMRWLLLVKPGIAISTAAVFGRLAARDYSDGSHSRAVCVALEAELEAPLADVHNGLERGVLEHYPEVARARADLLQAGADTVRLSGSGPTLFALFSTLAQALTVQGRMQDAGYEVYLSRALYPSNRDMCQL